MRRLRELEDRADSDEGLNESDSRELSQLRKQLKMTQTDTGRSISREDAAKIMHGSSKASTPNLNSPFVRNVAEAKEVWSYIDKLSPDDFSNLSPKKKATLRTKTEESRMMDRKAASNAIKRLNLLEAATEEPDPDHYDDDVD
jgi:hypothetical protein